VCRWTTLAHRLSVSSERAWIDLSWRIWTHSQQEQAPATDTEKQYTTTHRPHHTTGKARRIGLYDIWLQYDTVATMSYVQLSGGLIIKYFIPPYRVWSCWGADSSADGLAIHNSISLSLSAQDQPLAQIFSIIDSLKTDSTDFMTGPFLLSISVFVFSFFITLSCLVPCGRLSWLFVRFWAHVNKNLIVYRIVSYRNCAFSSNWVAV